MKHYIAATYGRDNTVWIDAESVLAWLRDCDEAVDKDFIIREISLMALSASTQRT